MAIASIQGYGGSRMIIMGEGMDWGNMYVDNNVEEEEGTRMKR